MEVKIDKRTKEYKEMVANPEVEVHNERIDNIIIEAAAKGLPPKTEAIEPLDSPAVHPTPKPKPDLLHCPGCGAELLEDERNGKNVAYCRACIWENA